MKLSRLFSICLLVFMLTTVSHEIYGQGQGYEYAYVSVDGKSFSKRLKVEVDLGDTEEKLEEGKKYSKTLSDKKSYMAVLNHLVENGFELVETFVNFSDKGTDETSGIVYLMRRRK